MSLSYASLLIIAGVFPTVEHDQISLGTYGLSMSSESPLDLSGFDPYVLRGLELRYRDISPADSLDEALATGRLSRLRLGIDSRGQVQLDELSLETALVSLKLRPTMGDEFDLALLGGDSRISWHTRNTERAFVRSYFPTNLTLLGLSNTDFDPDAKLKAYVSIGSGLGGEVLIRMFGGLGFHAQGSLRAGTMNRHQGGRDNQVRHEVLGEVETGLGYLHADFGVLLSAWGELATQWETRDDDGRSGVDRQHLTWGLRLTARWATSADSATDDDEEIEIAGHRRID